jgi:nudix-type nucleoside diphosphatase (YffH/AdpP family)
MTQFDTDSDAAQTQAQQRIRVSTRTLLSDRWARLEQVQFDYRRSDGTWQSQQREIYHRGHGAAILLYNEQLCTIVLTRQFRFPAWELDGNGFLLEVPAGIIEDDNPAATIQIETQQETGYLVDRPEFLFKAFATPGSVTEQLHYFKARYDPARRMGQGGGLIEEGEDIEVLEVPIDKAVGWIADGTVVDAKTIVLILYAQLHLF